MEVSNRQLLIAACTIESDCHFGPTFSFVTISILSTFFCDQLLAKIEGLLYFRNENARKFENELWHRWVTYVWLVTRPRKHVIYEHKIQTAKTIVQNISN